ncbi:hypothetical protein LY90DRAFT_662934 [Neocallimastix californiae]|jgi:hypothetical protein|uniref:Dickkopf N-terminal cysteine-rich domain-containing protein n=1 Tax=Neocallimastix californiae TaxID=1754190 RepID=A0A1Y2FT74_9FUNG|nr:hypothetical protein LY90DRAFT_662934 [Neocallimastix californiae]|eukprot:ORY87210.1 hypothetical protein LY90DRAFT_662934 [Neocallimastix californiae]
MKFVNSFLILLSCLFSFTYAGFASSVTNTTDYVIFPHYKLEDIKKLPIISCKDDSDCPSYSNRCAFDVEIDAGVCDINAYCNKFNGCVALLSSFDSHKSSSLIIDSFQTPNDQKDVNISKCKSDSDCFTNICKQGVCLVDDSDPVYNCIIAEIGVHQSHVNCGKAANQLCYDHEDCISNQCFDVCDSNYYNHASDASSLTISKIMGIMLFLILSFILV